MEKTQKRKRFMCLESYIAYIFVLSLIGNRNVAALSITVTELECVSEQVLAEGDTIFGNFVAIDHDIFWSHDHPVILKVTSPGGSTVFSLKGTSGDKFEFKATQNGIYKFCFRNPSLSPETVSFYIHVGHIPTEQDLAKDEHMDPLNIKIAELREALESITAEQRYLKAHDARHRYTNLSTKKRVIYFTLAEYIVFAGASALQVVYIRNLFSKTVGYNIEFKLIYQNPYKVIPLANFIHLFVMIFGGMFFVLCLTLCLSSIFSAIDRNSYIQYYNSDLKSNSQ